MTTDLTDLSRALVALEGWRWEAGMLAAEVLYPPESKRCLPLWEDVRVIDGDGGCYNSAGRYRSVYDSGQLPDLTDAATGGILLVALGPWWTAGDRAQSPDEPADWYVATLKEQPPGSYSSVDWERHEGATLAAACARALVAREWYSR